ncbi:MAG: response regulator [bacterium]
MSPPHILLIDDDLGMRTVLKDILEDSGYMVTTAEDGESAIEKVNENNFDLVITDLRMPNMDGMEFLDYIEQNHPELKVVVVTAFGRDKFSEAKMLGAFEFLSKGVRIEELKKVIANIINRTEKT